MTSQERVGKGLDLLKQGVAPFVEREVRAAMGKGKSVAAVRAFAEDPLFRDKAIDKWDASLLLKFMWDSWNEVFRDILGHAERNLVSEIRGHRNNWAHQHAFSSDDADRALDSIARLLTAVSAPQAAIERQATGTLKPWRKVVTPHRDVASGRYQQAEFAADLWQVHLGEGSDEYRKPVEFFRRTYLTESLGKLLTGAIRRLSGQGGDRSCSCR